MDNHVHLSFRIISMSILVVNHHFWWMDFFMTCLNYSKPATNSCLQSWRPQVAWNHGSRLQITDLQIMPTTVIGKRSSQNLRIQGTQCHCPCHFFTNWEEDDIMVCRIRDFNAASGIDLRNAICRTPTSDGKIHGSFRFFTMTNPRSPPPRL